MNWIVPTGWGFVLECVVKIVASVFCGFVLGIERKSRKQVVGMRTLILIAVSSTLLSILSYYMAEQGNRRGYTGGDPTRIVAGVVSGIGFLGGGTIIRHGLNVRGLTSAAIIWTASALGLSIGVGLYLQSAVVLVTAVGLLVYLERIEEKWFPVDRSKVIHLVYNISESENLDVKTIEKILRQAGIVISDVNLSRDFENQKISLKFSTKVPREENFLLLLPKLQENGKLLEFSVSE